MPGISWYYGAYILVTKETRTKWKNPSCQGLGRKQAGWFELTLERGQGQPLEHVALEPTLQRTERCFGQRNSLSKGSGRKELVGLRNWRKTPGLEGGELMVNHQTGRPGLGHVGAGKLNQGLDVSLWEGKPLEPGGPPWCSHQQQKPVILRKREIRESRWGEGLNHLQQRHA